MTSRREKEELIRNIAELMGALQIPRSCGMLRREVFPGASEAWDKVHRELAFGHPSVKEYEEALKNRLLRKGKHDVS